MKQSCGTHRPRTPYPAVVLIFTLSVAITPTAVLAQSDGADGALQARIDQLIQQLGDDDIAVREAAANELKAIGDPALEALERAAEDNEPERRAQAQAILYSEFYLTYEVVDENYNLFQVIVEDRRTENPVLIAEFYPNGQLKSVTKYRGGKPVWIQEYDVYRPRTPPDHLIAGELTVHTATLTGVVVPHLPSSAFQLDEVVHSRRSEGELLHGRHQGSLSLRGSDGPRDLSHGAPSQQASVVTPTTPKTGPRPQGVVQRSFGAPSSQGMHLDALPHDRTSNSTRAARTIPENRGPRASGRQGERKDQRSMGATRPRAKTSR